VTATARAGALAVVDPVDARAVRRAVLLTQVPHQRRAEDRAHLRDDDVAHGDRELAAEILRPRPRPDQHRGFRVVFLPLAHLLVVRLPVNLHRQPALPGLLLADLRVLAAQELALADLGLAVPACP
jgi:hypothetical protein